MPRDFDDLGGSPIARGPMGAGHYTSIHSLVFRDRRLSAKAMGIFAHLSTHSERWQVTEDTIAAAMRDGREAIRSGLRELEAAHYLVRSRQRRPDGREGPEIWFLTDLPAQLRATGITDPAVIEVQVRAAFLAWQQALAQQAASNPCLVGLPSPPVAPPPVDKLSEVLPRSEPKHKAPAGKDAALALFDNSAPKADTTNSRSSERALELLFEEFYESYPRKVGRKEAQRKFAKAVRDGADPRKIIDGARLYAKAMTGESDRFIAYPATWLHRGSWMDENPKPESRPTRSNGYQPFRNYEDQSVYDEEML